MTTLDYLEKIDDTLSHWEDYFHGQEGIDVTEARANLDKVRKQLRIGGVSNCAFAKGDRVIVFDAVAWNKVGKDVGDNSCFHKEATILDVYYHNSEIGSSDWCATVKFDDGRVSKGHFLWGLEHCY